MPQHVPVLPLQLVDLVQSGLVLALLRLPLLHPLLNPARDVLAGLAPLRQGLRDRGLGLWDAGCSTDPDRRAPEFQRTNESTGSMRRSS